MVIQYSGVAINAGSGKLGGNVILKNKVVRTKVTPANPQSSSQLSIRSLLTQLSQIWGSTLTQAQRDAWDAAAAANITAFKNALGDSAKVTGEAAFIRFSFNASIATETLTVVTNPPTLTGNGDAVLGALTVAAGAGTMTLSYTGAVTNTFQVFGTPPLSPGRQKAPTAAYRQFSITGAASPLNLAAAYVAQFGSLTGTGGKKIFVKVYAIDDTTGQRSLVGSTSDIIAS